MNSNSTWWQQGDVILEQVSPRLIRKGKAVEPTGDSLILVRGEVTGHAHRVAAAPGVSLINVAGVLYLSNQQPVTVAHEEHKPIQLPAGVFRVRQVREYDHLTEEARIVMD